jgi:WD40 repeat protein
VAPSQTFETTNFRPDGRAVVVGLPDGSAAVWSTTESRVIATLQGREGTFVSLAFSPDGASITGLRADGTLLIWEAP